MNEKANSGFDYKKKELLCRDEVTTIQLNTTK